MLIPFPVCEILNLRFYRVAGVAALRALSPRNRQLNRTKKMAQWYLTPPFLLILAFDVLSQVCALEADSRDKKSTLQPPNTNNNLKRHDSWPDLPRTGHKHGVQRKDKANTMVTRVMEAERPDEDGIGLESLTPVRVETDSLERAAMLEEGAGDQSGQFYPRELENYRTVESASKGKKHSRDHKKQNRRERGRHNKALKVSGTELIPSGRDLTQSKVMDELSTMPLPMSSAIVTSTLLTTITTEEAPAVKPRQQTREQARARTVAEVNPTLDMTLFDWTDYEDMKPDMWPSTKKKDKRRSKNLSNGNITSQAEAEPCDHHLDCLPGFRCYAKFHRNRRVTRRRGRCVEPDSVNNDHGSFITV
ncbi:draxin isoform X2 [Hemitrygon akajei]|uniref:draxin isoform X2 n=1 Tax=Hemitrygon akajei TaxID=2704970 RepID=UPI003BFA266E